MKFKVAYSKDFRVFWILYQELYGKKLASFEIHLFRIATGVMFKKDVRARGKHVVDTFEDEI